MVKKGLINEKYAMDAQFVKLYAKLEMWYPEHKVYSMDAIDKHLREDFSKFAKDHGKTIEELLKEIGFESISGEDVYALRGPAKYSPGKEPEIIKSKVERILIKLKDAYPDKIITKSLQNDNKRLSSEILGISKWLGYKNSEEFLKRYGFEYQYLQKGGRPTTDTDDVIEELKKRYPDGPAFSKQGDLFNANPDLAGKLKTLANNAKQLYGVSSKEYLCQQGLLSSGKTGVSLDKTQVSIDKSSKNITNKPIKLPKIERNPKIKTDIEWCKTGGYCVRSAYGRAVFRGFKSQIDEAVDFICDVVTPKYTIDNTFMKVSKTKNTDIYEICIMNTIDQDETHDIVGKVLAKFPCLKMVSFYDELYGEGSVVYSESGYNYVTDIKFVGYYDHKSDYPFVWEKNPTKDFNESFVFVQTGDRGKINYRFPFRKQWESFDYVLHTKDCYIEDTISENTSCLTMKSDEFIDEIIDESDDYLEDTILDKTYCLILIRNVILNKIIGENDCYIDEGNFELTDENGFFAIKCFEQCQVPKDLDNVHKELLDMLSQDSKIASEINRKNNEIRDSYEYVFWCDCEGPKYEYMHGCAKYIERIDGELLESAPFEGVFSDGPAKAKLVFYAKTGKEWNVLAKIDLKKYGINIDLSCLQGKTEFIFGYENGWKPDINTIESLNKEIVEILASSSNNDLFYFIFYPIPNYCRCNYFLGNGLHTNNFKEKNVDMMDADYFFGGMPDFCNFRDVLKKMDSDWWFSPDNEVSDDEFSELSSDEQDYYIDVITSDEWINLEEFGITLEEILDLPFITDSDGNKDSLIINHKKISEEMKELIEYMLIAKWMG